MKGMFGRQPRHTLIDVVERLEIWQLHHNEEHLLGRIFDRGRCREDLIEVLLNLLRDGQRVKGGPFDADGDVPQSPRGVFNRQEIVHENRMKIEDRVAIEAGFIRCVDQKLGSHPYGS